MASDDEDNRDAEMHEGEVPRERLQYPCVFTYDNETCPRAFSTKDELDRHRWKYHNEQTSVTFATPDLDGSKTVSVLREPKVDGTFVCPRCSKKYTKAAAIQAHAQTDYCLGDGSGVRIGWGVFFPEIGQSNQCSIQKQFN
jgi:hypothetical protein